MLTARDVWPERIRPLRRIEYEALVRQGLLDEARVELLLGGLVTMTPQGPPHAEVVHRLAERFMRGLSGDVRVRVQSPLALSEDSEPEPDIAVVRAADYHDAHPREALLVIEVADTSLLKDRGIKTALYATAGVPEFWLVNLTDRSVDVHRKPVAGRYEQIVHIEPGGELEAEIVPTGRIPLADILP